MPTSDLSSLDDPTFRRELLVVASFLAGYGTSTRNSYATDLRLFAEWCRDYGLTKGALSFHVTSDAGRLLI